MRKWLWSHNQQCSSRRQYAGTAPTRQPRLVWRHWPGSFRKRGHQGSGEHSLCEWGFESPWCIQTASHFQLPDRLTIRSWFPCHRCEFKSRSGTLLKSVPNFGAFVSYPTRGKFIGSCPVRIKLCYLPDPGRSWGHQSE
jgi:hypothetical protein